MANDFSANPIKIDTVFTTGQIVSKTNVRATSMIWQSPTTVGHRLTIKDRNSKIIADVLCAVANQDVDLTYICGWFQGLQVTLIDSGALYIYQ